MLEACINWIKNNSIPGEGLAISSKRRACYPEVTGYTIPTLLAAGEKQLAKNYVRWLQRIQLPDGGFSGAGAPSPLAFDTGQVVRGLVALVKDMPELELPLTKACDWIIASSNEQGRLPVPAPGTLWIMANNRGDISEGIHLYCLPQIKEAGEILNRPDYIRFVEKSKNYYLSNVSLTNFHAKNSLTHFYAYVQDALFDLGCADKAAEGMKDVETYQQENGAVPAFSDVHWVCSTGLAQLSLVWYKLGNRERADQAYSFVKQLQNSSGGFFGSYGPGATYFPDQEISWAAKFAIDLDQIQIKTFFDNKVDIFPTGIDIDDGRLQVIVRNAGNLNSQSVLDVGCGKGRFSSALKDLFPNINLTASDISPEMLKCVRPDIKTVEAGILDLPFATNSYDVVFCVEALEHVVKIERGLAELVRVTKPNGLVIVVDKNKEKLGALNMPAWEKWFSIDEIKNILEKMNVSVTAEFVTYNKKPADGLMVAWVGRKQ